MADKQVTVIIPVYNVSQYLRECLDSVLAQTYENLQIIVIDDGSTDSCPEICDEYANKDSRIVVIHQENAGLSAARNAGLDIMTGEYVCFIDSDDFVAPDYCEVLLTALIENNVDISVCGTYEFLEEKEDREIRRKYEGQGDRCGDRIFSCNNVSIASISAVQPGLKCISLLFSMKFVILLEWYTKTFAPRIALER